jgi:hypothetical protein
MCVGILTTTVIAQTTTKAGVVAELDRRSPLHLRVTLRSGAASDVTIYRADLPWGNRYSMVFAAVRPSGESLDLMLPIDDPGPTKTSLKAGESLTGDVDLRYVIRDVNALKESDVLLFWAYKAPQELHLPEWIGGMVLVPKQK